MPINTTSIMNKLMNGAQSDGFKKRNKNGIIEKAEENAELATARLLWCIQDAIASSGLSGNEIAAIGEVDAAGPYEFDGGSKFMSVVYIDQQSRPSLYPSVYGEGAYDMAGLLDKGFDSDKKVWGEWNGEIIFGKMHRPATHFVQNGVENFNGNYAAEYHAHATVDSGRFS